MKKILLALVFTFMMTSLAYGTSRNFVEETGEIKSAGEVIRANFVIHPNDEVATGSYIELHFENAIVFSNAIINGTGKPAEKGFNGTGKGYQYSGFRGYKWNSNTGFYDAMADRPTSAVPYKITKLSDYAIRVDLCNIPKEWADTSLSLLNGSYDAPYYSISLPVYVKDEGAVRIVTKGKVNDKTLTYGRYVFNTADSAVSTEKTTETTTQAVQTKVNESANNRVAVSIGSRVMTVNGTGQEIDAAPYIQEGGYTLIPLRAVSIALADGYSGNGSINIVSWDGSTKTAIINYRGKTVSFKAGSSVMVSDGEEKAITGGIPEITQGRMFVPFRVLGEELSAEVSWIAETKTAVFN